MTSAFPRQIVEEARRGHGRGSLASPRSTVRAENPLCGDEIELDVDHDGDRLIRVAQRTRGCSFTGASASLLARTVPGLEVARARELCDALRRDLAGQADLPPEVAALASVRVYPARLRCALLPWEALRSALDPAP